MKISLWVPIAKDYQWIQKFLDKEIAQAGNIKSDDTKKSVLQGLSTAKKHIHCGLCIYIDGVSFLLEQYDGRTFNYHCGNEYQTPTPVDDYK